MSLIIGPNPLFQSDAFDMKLKFSQDKFVPNLVLKVRVFGNRKWPITHILQKPTS